MIIEHDDLYDEPDYTKAARDYGRRMADEYNARIEALFLSLCEPKVLKSEPEVPGE